MQFFNRYSKVKWIGLQVLVWLAFASGAHSAASHVSGRLVEGLRRLSVPAGEDTLHYKVFRGDYIKFELPPGTSDATLKIPDLGINAVLPPDTGSAPYFKMKQSGRFAFTLGSREGLIEVLDYKPANYREMTAAQTEAFIAQNDPLILDVRTPAEFKGGHLSDAVLIPVQELQRRIGELAPYRNRDILVYCATGNRSTVAAKILIDQGFTRIANMRHGIVDWHQRKYPVVR
jgi:rhodanese-related sulfurtransferase